MALEAALRGEPKAAILERAGDGPSVLQRTRIHPAPSLRAPRRLRSLRPWTASPHSGNFRDAVLISANLGGNSDVVAATCGALADAHYTAGTIPASWRNSLIKKQLIESTADRLLAHALLDVGG